MLRRLALRQTLVLFAVLLGGLVGAAASPATPPRTPPAGPGSVAPRAVILLLGDGLGFSLIALARYATKGRGGAERAPLLRGQPPIGPNACPA